MTRTIGESHIYLEAHLVGLLAILKRELGGNVSLKQRCLGDDTHEAAVHLLLQSLAAPIKGGLLLLLEEKLVVLLLGGLGLLEEVIVHGVRDLHLGHVDLGLGRNDVRLPM